MSLPTPIKVVCALIERDGQFLVGKRPEGKMLAGKWEFPGGKIDAGETAEEALKREILEELGVAIRVGKRVGAVIHAVDASFSIELIGFLCVLKAGAVPVALEHSALFWGDFSTLEELDLGEADVGMLLKLKEGGE